MLALRPKIHKIADLQKRAYEIRFDVLKSLAEAGSGHTGASLGLADIFTYLFFNQMHFDPSQPEHPGRDRFILSVGHVAPLYYTSLAHAGFFDVAELQRLRKLGSRLQGHPALESALPGLETSSGSLGQGLSIAVGKALVGKLDQKNWKVYCACGDGELQEGAIWEAAMSAAHHRLNNLCVVVDRNHLQIDGSTENVMALEPLTDKWKAFGWNCLLCDGHHFPDIKEAFDHFPHATAPTVILANTTMGRGVASIENNYQWHGKAPSKEQLPLFLNELKDCTDERNKTENI